MAYIGAGKPNVVGGIYAAPKGTTLPTDAKTALNEAFKSIGYISEDGVTNDNSPSGDAVKEWGGTIVANLMEERPDEWKFAAIETTNLEALKMVYGKNNVTGTIDTGITIQSKAEVLEEHALVIDMVLGDYLKRIVIPLGVVSELGTITYKGNEVMKFDMTITAHGDDTGVSHYDYSVKKTA